MQPPFPLALPPPDGELALLSRELLETAKEQSRLSPRRRIIQPFHKSNADLLHRMLNVVQPDSYIRPHRHLDPPKAEAWVLLSGSLLFFTFEDNGSVRNCVVARAGGDVFGVDLVPGVFHSFIALEPDTTVYEVKTGPYAPSNDKTFASWAPAENSDERSAYVEGLRAYAQRKGVL
jgi:cupin fold WbuC family metalloprotein